MKKLLALGAFLLSFTASACWYQYSQHTDYIYSINDKVLIDIDTSDPTLMKYSITNNQVVDFPLTVSVKLISNTTVKNYEGHDAPVGNIIRSSLQYRVLPHGDWVTVVNYNTKMETIESTVPPKTYFGKNNINPRGLHEGDIVMIRLYVTDGEWQSGDMEDDCSSLLETIDLGKYGTKMTLPNFNYNVTALGLLGVDLGGSWYPHLCCTVIYSGKNRMIR